MPRLSILIPCLGGPDAFDGTLVSVLQNRPARCEVVVLHTAAYEDPYGLSGEVRFICREQLKSLVELINAGIEAASGDIIHVLGSGLEATDGWAEPALAHFGDDDVGAVVPAVTSADRSRVVSTGVRWSIGGSRCVLASPPATARCGPMLAAGFFRRDLLLAIGGLDAAAGDAMSDVDFALKLHELDLRAVIEPSSRLTQVTDPLAASRHDGFRGARAAEHLFWRNASPTNLPLALAAHGLAVLADVAAHGPMSLLGRMGALADIGALARHRSRMAAVAARLADACSNERATLPLAPAHTAKRSALQPSRKAA